MLPLTALCKFSAHEDEFFARLGIHVGKHQPQVGEFLPVVARHLGQQGALAVDNLIMRERHDEVL